MDADDSFLAVVKRDSSQLAQLQDFFLIQFMVLQYVGKRCKLLYDGRHLKKTKSTLRLEIWILDRVGNLIEKKDNLCDCKKAFYNLSTHISKQEPLAKLLNLPTPELHPDPISCQATLDFLLLHGIDNVSIVYCFSSKAHSSGEYWIRPPIYSTTLEVFTTANYTLGFRKYNSPKPRFRKKTLEKSNNTAAPQVTNVPVLDDYCANRSSGVNVKSMCLNLALNLGCCTKEDFADLSRQLGSACTASIWMECDDKNVARYVSVLVQSYYFQIEIQNELSWEKVFEFIDNKKLTCSAQKEKILKPLLDVLQGMSPATAKTLYTTCLAQLKYFVGHLKIVAFSTDDNAIHAIKLHFANYIKKKHKNRCVSLNSNSKNDLVILKTSDITIFNLNMYLKDLVDADSVIASPNITSNIKFLKKQPKPGMTMLLHCKLRGKQMCTTLLSTWDTVGAFFLETFDFDLFTIPCVSLSLLAFQTIWTKYSKRAGIFHQALEKSKASYVATFRQHSHGGFSFSCQDALQLNDPIHGHGGQQQGEPALAILNYDITSSYGYGGSNIQTPSGFCNAFENIGNGILKRCEPISRHKTFEFKSVYYTLWLLNQDGLNIQTVYSNFHSNGMFSISKYIVDLAVICVNGDMHIYQFDGQFCHSCREGCVPLRSYIHGKSSTELEMATETRDDITMEWVNKANLKKQGGSVFYKVISNCHSVGYSEEELKKAFDNIPTLHNIIDGYPNSKTLTQDEVLMCSNKMTYIAIVDGYIPSSSSSSDNVEFKPLLFKLENKSTWSKGSSTAESGQLLLTKDYVDWLVKYFNFQITTIHKVYIYKKCSVLNGIFKDLTHLRMTPTISIPTKQLVKNVINYAAGFFGLNEDKGSNVKYKIVTSVGARYETRLNALEQLGQLENNHFQLKSRCKKKKCVDGNSKSFAPIPVFVFIVEFGKLRMSQIMSFFDKFLILKYFWDS